MLTLLSRSDWSPWFLAMKGAADISTGDPKLTAFAADKHKPAMYELSVQTRDADAGVKKPVKNHVVFCKITRGVPYGRSWSHYVFEGKDLQDHLANVLSQNCTVHIRRALLPKTFHTTAGKMIRTVNGIRNEVKSHMSYAWLSKDRQTKCCRMIKRDGKTISS